MASRDFPIQGFSSLAIHAGHEDDPRHSHLTPIYANSTFVFDDAEQGMRRFSGQEPGYIYTRWGNPNMTEAEAKIAAMETFGVTDASGSPLQVDAILHASGMAAISTLLLSNLSKGDRVLSHYSLYGGTQDYMNRILPTLGMEAVIRDLRDPQQAEDALARDPSIKMVYLETPANPTIQCVDIEALAEIAHRHGRIVACDNTFATPYLQQPFRHGADFVVHSTTKFLNGHGNIIGGILLGRDTGFMRTTATKTHRLLGGNSNAFESWLLVNGMKTLELRMERHCHNAMEVAGWLDTHAAVAQVNYNGLPQHPDHYVALRQMRHPGAMLSFEMKGGLEAGIRVMDSLRLCTRTVSLGTCDTLLCHPASMTHTSVPREDRLRYGITDGLIRMSVGMENISDILNDLDQALAKA
ncbi:MAG: aminotransferase class I/II-fold pyridoxal phosphate-dependent enzyme [Chitinophagia bacterium]|nr:aminotransferase class I/II-fold pyridoxal phosphate-dependent enzyme [Chitinophagia bacterium]